VNTLYPLFLKLSDARCVVIGGGDVAAQKVTQLLDCEATVTVISPTLTADLAALAQSGRIVWEDRMYRPGDLRGCLLAIGATDDREAHTAIAQEAGRAGVLCNIVDEPDLCQFYVPSVLTQGDLKIAVSTNGFSPSLARKIRLELEEQFGPAYAQFLEVLGSLREESRRRFPDDAEKRKVFLEGLVWSPALDLLKSGDAPGFHNAVQAWISS